MALYGKSSNEHFENIKKGITRIYEHQKKGLFWENVKKAGLYNTVTFRAKYSF